MPPGLWENFRFAYTLARAADILLSVLPARRKPQNVSSKLALNTISALPSFAPRSSRCPYYNHARTASPNSNHKETRPNCVMRRENTWSNSSKEKNNTINLDASSPR